MNSSQKSSAFIKFLAGKKLRVRQTGYGFFRIFEVDGHPVPIVIELSQADFTCLCSADLSQSLRQSIELISSKSMP